MGHCIGYLDFRKSETTQKKIFKKVCGFANDQNKGNCYHGNLTFHETPIYKNRDEAEKAIKLLVNDFYDDHAVLYKNGRYKMWLVKFEFHFWS